VDREETVAGRPRRYYRLTDLGRQALLEEAARMQHAAGIVTRRPATPTAGLATGEPVMAIGGFNGSDPAPTLASGRSSDAHHHPWRFAQRRRIPDMVIITARTTASWTQWVDSLTIRFMP
jgi:hypothetical protein